MMDVMMKLGVWVVAGVLLALLFGPLLWIVVESFSEFGMIL